MPSSFGAFLCLPRTMSLLALALLLAAPAPAVTLEYLGHSCFVITAASGRRLLVDPYASGEWPGLELPYAHADTVLMTHPHWDHSAWRAVRGGPKLIDGPGRVKGKGYVVRGIAGRHAETGGAAIDHRNTIFVVQTGGLTLCHLGDNGPVTEELKVAVGRVDVLMLPVDAERRVLTYEQAAEWIEALSPRIVVPMHYLLPGLSLQNVKGIGAIDEWLSLQPRVVVLPGDRMALDAATLPGQGARVVKVFTLPGQRPPGPAAGASGSGAATEARRRAEIAAAEGDMATALAEFTRAASLDPGDLEALQKIGYLHLAGARPDRALEFFTRAVGAAGEEDAGRLSLAWLGAGMALDLLGRREEALAAYGKVIQAGVNDEHQVDQARRYLESPYRED